MTLSLNCQTILWPVPHSGHPVRWPLGIGVTQCPQIHPRCNMVQKGVQLVTKVCYYLEFSYIYKQLIISKKALCLIAEGCMSGVYIIDWISATYEV